MQLTTPPEMTTAITDILLGFQALYVYGKIKNLPVKTTKTKIWAWVFLLLVGTSFYGSIAHAVVMEKWFLNLFWHPLSFMLGMLVSMFVVGVVVEWKGESVFKSVLKIMIGLGILFFIIMLVLSTMIEGYFIVFIAYSTLTMLFSLFVYIYLAYKRSEESTKFLAFGILLILAGSVVQALRSVSFTLVWEFDYNSVYHFFMMGAVFLFQKGTVK